MSSILKNSDSHPNKLTKWIQTQNEMQKFLKIEKKKENRTNEQKGWNPEVLHTCSGAARATVAPGHPLSGGPWQRVHSPNLKENE